LKHKLREYHGLTARYPQLLLDSMVRIIKTDPSSPSTLYQRRIATIAPALLTAKSLIMQPASLGNTAAQLYRDFGKSYALKISKYFLSPSSWRNSDIEKLISEVPAMYMRRNMGASALQVATGVPASNNPFAKASRYIFGHADMVTMNVIWKTLKDLQKDQAKKGNVISYTELQDMFINYIAEGQNTANIADANMIQLYQRSGDLLSIMIGIFQNQVFTNYQFMKKTILDKKMTFGKKTGMAALTLGAHLLCSFTHQLFEKIKDGKEIPTIINTFAKTVDDFFMINPLLKFMGVTFHKVLTSVSNLVGGKDLKKKLGLNDELGRSFGNIATQEIVTVLKRIFTMRDRTAWENFKNALLSLYDGLKIYGVNTVLIKDTFSLIDKIIFGYAGKKGTKKPKSLEDILKNNPTKNLLKKSSVNKLLKK
jgi:hypothetical protein